MKKASKRAVFLIFIVYVILSMCTSMVFASAQTTLTVETVSAVSGEDVEVAIDLSGNESGILGMMISVSYDNNLTLKRIDAGDALSSLDFTPGKPLTANPINIAWDGLDADNTNGTVAVLTFSLPENASGSYSVNISYTEGNIYDNDYNDIPMTLVNGEIIVGSAITEPTMSIENLVKGETTTFTLDLVSPDSISGKVVVATYSNGKMHLCDTVVYDAAASRNVSVNTKGMGTLKIFWWDNLSDIKPVAEAIEIDLTK